jgi:hypothetical protein
MADIESLLSPPFPAKHISAAVGHFVSATEAFGQSDWERCIARSGKFVEAILKALGAHCNVPFETGRKFKADRLLNGLQQLPDQSFDDSLRLLIPRACRVIYDIASNRGARHDPHEIDANSMDANLVIPMCGWVLAEAIRFAKKGDPQEASVLVEGLVEKKYPAVEVIDERVYLHAKKKSAVDVLLVALAKNHPKRMSRIDLMTSAQSNGFSKANASTAIGRIRKFVDEDDDGMMRLLSTGLQKAEEIITDAIRETR